LQRSTPERAAGRRATENPARLDSKRRAADPQKSTTRTRLLKCQCRLGGYPTGRNPASGLPWSPATDGLRNLTGRVNRDGTARIWAITSTVSGSGDQGADPNKLVMITDNLSATSLPAGESFTTLRTARFAEVLRGVSFTPGTGMPPHHDDEDDRGR